MRRFVDVMECALIVSTLEDGHYTPTARRKPPQSYGQGKQWPETALAMTLPV